MAVFFKPSDIVTLACSVNAKIRSGSAFATCEDGEQVYIVSNLAKTSSLEVGDFLTAYCIPNYNYYDSDADKKDRGSKSVRWRAIKIVVQERFQIPPIDTRPEPVKPKPELTAEKIEQRILSILDEDRAYTTAQAALHTGIDQMRVANGMRSMHERGLIAACEISASGGQERVSKLYYARDVDLLVDLIDDVVLDD